jgi:hypothetical protein
MKGSNKINSVKLYYSVDTQMDKIKLENKGKSVIYLWTNLTNGKNYVGSSVDLNKRFTQYFNINFLIRHNYMAINRALLKFGYSNFSLKIIEYWKAEGVKGTYLFSRQLEDKEVKNLLEGEWGEPSWVGRCPAPFLNESRPACVSNNNYIINNNNSYK